MNMYKTKFICLQSYKKSNLAKIQERLIRLIFFKEFISDNSSMTDLRVMNVVAQSQ